MQILGLLGMYFDAVVVFVMKFSTSFKLAIPRWSLENEQTNVI